LWGGKPFDVVYANWKGGWLAAGLAVVTMDCRGCGASFGTWKAAWSDDEVSDSLEVLGWINAQPWASAKVLLFGQSYDAGCALRTAAAARAGTVTAVVAVNPFLDMYESISLPGGIFQEQFGTRWSGLIKAFDSQRLGSAPAEAGMIVAVARGVARALPEDELTSTGTQSASWLQRLRLRQRRQALLEAAVKEHATNWAPLSDVEHVTFIDDKAPGLQASIEDINCARFLPALAASGIPILWTSAWFDATVTSASAGFAATKHIAGTELLIGPWTHMLWQHVVTSGRGSSRLTAFPVPKETLRWALQFVGPSAGARAAAAAPTSSPAAAASAPHDMVNIFEMGTGRWLHLPDWPHASAVTYYLAPGRCLTAAAPSSDTPVTRDEVRVRLQDKPGGFSRWRAMLNIGKLVRYRRLRKLPLMYVSVPPLDAPLRMCGSPVVTLFMDTSDGSGDVFAYLVDVDPSGKAHYVAEGCLRLIHRRIVDDPAAMGPRFGVMLPQSAPSLPLRSFSKADVSAAMPRPPETPAEVKLPLMPACYVFARGHRVGLALTGSDDTHFRPLPGTAGRVLGFSHGSSFSARIELPMLT